MVARYFFLLGSGDSRLSKQGGHDSKTMFIVRPIYYKLDFLHLHTLKIGLKIHVCALKILDLAMPMHMLTFHQDFHNLILVGGPVPPQPPLNLPMLLGISALLGGALGIMELI